VAYYSLLNKEYLSVYTYIQTATVISFQRADTVKSWLFVAQSKKVNRFPFYYLCNSLISKLFPVPLKIMCTDQPYNLSVILMPIATPAIYFFVEI
jgi:hypothetical protein